MLCEERSIDEYVLEILGEITQQQHFSPLASKKIFEYTKNQLENTYFIRAPVKVLLWLIGEAFAQLTNKKDSNMSQVNLRAFTQLIINFLQTNPSMAETTEAYVALYNASCFDFAVITEPSVAIITVASYLEKCSPYAMHLVLSFLLVASENGADLELVREKVESLDVTKLGKDIADTLQEVLDRLNAVAGEEDELMIGSKNQPSDMKI